MKEYYAYKSMVSKAESFSLMPLSQNTPFIDGMFYSEHAFLLLLSRDTKERFQMIPKIDDFGVAVTDKSVSKREKLDRVKLESSYEYYLSDPDDIRWFIRNHVENSKQFLEFFESVLKERKEKEKELEKKMEELEKMKKGAEEAKIQQE